MRGSCKLDFVDEVCGVVCINHRWEVVKGFFIQESRFVN